MTTALRKLLKPFYQQDLHWYFPRAFFPYPNHPEGLPGFHQFLKLVAEQPPTMPWSQQDEEAILDELRKSGAMRYDLDAAEDYHVHYRNRRNFGKKLGFLELGTDRPLRLTDIGKAFTRASPAQQMEIIEHQLIRWQFTNPTFPERYAEFKLFPYLFTLSVLLDVPGNFLSLGEFTLRVSLARDYTEKDAVCKWVDEFRHLSDSEREFAKTQIELMRNYESKVLMLLFACTPALSLTDNTLVLTDPERAALIQTKCWPRLGWHDYTENEWEANFGQFNTTFWPLVRPRTKRKRKAYKKYTRREGSSAHRDIKQYVINNAEILFGYGVRFLDEEYYFPSSDRANLVFISPDGKWITVEVEVDIPQRDIVGVLQAIKYKYMCAVQEGLPFDRIRTALVAHSIPNDIKNICAAYGVEIFEVAIP